VAEGPAPTSGPAHPPRPAFYAAGSGGFGDWWTLLHPPYTAWILAYVVVGACLAPTVDVTYLLATLLAFFLAVGVGAHALDELHDRPLRTAIGSRALLVAAVVGIGGAVALGIAGVVEVGWVLVPFVVVGPALAVAYNFELGGGIVHNDLGFAASWGAFPVLTAYVAQAGSLSWAAAVAALAALFLSLAQRALSTPARLLRRRARVVQGSVTLADGEQLALDHRVLLAPLERALKMTAWAVVLGATALALYRLA